MDVLRRWQSTGGPPTLRSNGRDGAGAGRAWWRCWIALVLLHRLSASLLPDFGEPSRRVGVGTGEPGLFGMGRLGNSHAAAPRWPARFSSSPAALRRTMSHTEAVAPLLARARTFTTRSPTNCPAGKTRGYTLVRWCGTVHGHLISSRAPGSFWPAPSPRFHPRPSPVDASMLDAVG